MAEKKENKSKIGAIIGFCAIIVAVIAIIIVITVSTSKPILNDSYFVSDDTKLVITYNNEDLKEANKESEETNTTEEDQDAEDTSETAQVKSYLVYYYKDDKITDMKAYYEFIDEATAKSAFEYYKENGDSANYKDLAINGKYVVITANESEYENLTATEVKEQIELTESLKNAEVNGEIETEEEVEEIEEPTE